METGWFLLVLFDSVCSKSFYPIFNDYTHDKVNHTTREISQCIYSPKWHCFPNFHCASLASKEKFESPGSFIIYTCTCLELYKFYTHYSLTCNLIGCRRILSDLHVLTFKWVKYGKYMTLVYQLFTSFWIPRIFKYLFIIVGNVFLIFIITLLVYTMKLSLFEFFFKGSYSNSQYNTFFSVLKRC